tara:strand:- start:83 stop:514 length:432 start_codon:yes stop_codon:yes gene_type:complete
MGLQVIVLDKGGQFGKIKQLEEILERVGRWMEEKIDWFFEDDDEWLDNEDLDGEFIQENTINSKRPLGAISLRVPKALPPGIDKNSNNPNSKDEWPDDQSFKVNRWERKNNLIQQNGQNLNESFQNERSSRKRNIPRSSRKKY